MRITLMFLLQACAATHACVCIIHEYIKSMGSYMPKRGVSQPLLVFASAAL